MSRDFNRISMVLLYDFLYNYHWSLNFVLWFSKRKILPSSFECSIFLLLSNKFPSILSCVSPISRLGGVLCDGYEIDVVCDVTAVTNVLIYFSTTQYDCAFVLSGCRNIPHLLLVWKTDFVLYCLKFSRIWGLFHRASSSWNNVKCQLDATG